MPCSIWQANELTYVNAGHNPPLWVKQDGTIERLTRTAIALGVVTGEPVEQRTIKLESCDNLFLYTDGLTESFNAEGEFYGEERLLEAIQVDVLVPPPLTCWMWWKNPCSTLCRICLPPTT